MIKASSCFFGIIVGVLLFAAIDVVTAFYFQPYETEKTLALVDVFISPFTLSFYLLIGLAFRLALNDLARRYVPRPSRISAVVATIAAGSAYVLLVLSILVVLSTPQAFSVFWGAPFRDAMAFQSRHLAKYAIVYFPSIVIGVVVFIYDNLRKRDDVGRSS